VANITVTNNDLGSVALEVWGTLDATVNNATAAPVTLAEGTLLARNVADGKLYPYDPASVTPDVNVPKYVLTYEHVAPVGDSKVTVMTAGKVNQNRLRIHAGTAIAAVHLDALLDRPIIPVDIAQLAKIDNPQA
jgi:hypothetical protein